MKNNIKIIGNINSTININQYVYEKLDGVNFLNQIAIIKNLDRDLIGRKLLLDKIEKSFQKNNAIGIYGIGGIGKTHIARAFISKNYESYSNIAWISIGNSIEESFTDDSLLIKNLNIENQLDGITNRNKKCEIILNRLNNIGGEKNLLIIDNSSKDIYSFLNKHSLSNNWEFIIISRGEIQDYPSIEIPELNLKSAIELFRKYCKKKSNEDDIVEIINHVKLHTLSIELLAVTIQRNLLLKVTDLRKILESRISEIYQLDKKVSKSAIDYLIEKEEYSASNKMTYNEVMELCFNLNDYNNLTQKNLLFLSFFGGIKLDINCFAKLITGYNVTEEKLEELGNEIVFLAEAGWIKVIDDFIEVHNVIADFLKVKLQPTLKNCSILIDNLHEIFESFYRDGKSNNPEFYFMVGYGDKIIEVLFDDRNEKIGIICNRLTILEAFDLNKGLLYAERYLQFIKRLYKNIPHKNIEIANYNMGKIHFKLGNLKEGLEYAIEAHRIFDVINPKPTKENIFDGIVNLELLALCSMNYSACNQFAKEYQIFSVLDENLWKRFIYPHKVFFILSNYSLTKGDIGSSIKHIEKALSICKQSKLLSNAPEIPHLLLNLSQCYWRKENYKKAVELNEICINKSKSIYGENHIMTIKSLHNSTIYFYILNDLKKAKEYSNNAYIRIQKYKNDGSDSGADDVIAEVKKFYKTQVENKDEK